LLLLTQLGLALILCLQLRQLLLEGSMSYICLHRLSFEPLEGLLHLS
jgi:hypothetical protein